MSFKLPSKLSEQSSEWLSESMAPPTHPPQPVCVCVCVCVCECVCVCVHVCVIYIYMCVNIYIKTYECKDVTNRGTKRLYGSVSQKIAELYQKQFQFKK
jgi:hypothetical protein